MSDRHHGPRARATVKIGLLADIHANLPALQAVLDRAEQLSIERLYILGDTVGYYYWPAECFELIEQWPHIMIGGNHEGMLLEINETPERLTEITRMYGHGLQIAAADLTASQLRFCMELPPVLHVEMGDRRIVLCHGTPWARDAYIYPDAGATERENMALEGASYVFFGHTHYPTSWRIDNTFIHNPGSVGQPRNRVPGAHWAILDTASGRIEPQREDYDITEIVGYCRRRDPELPYLANVLNRL
jgi:putative phosphoesterase